MVGLTVLHYRIRQKLGAGGMGEVYLAEDTRLGREVALKFLPASAQEDAERRSRFITEARAASALRSSNIAAIYDIGQHDGADFLVMEFVEGETLADRLKRGALPLREAVDVALQIADALVEAHARGVVHRDIKSANVIVTARGQAKVLDFGLAKFVDPPGGKQSSIDSRLTMVGETVAGAVMGTAAYMSPEQALGRGVDGRSDVFSLGVVLYEAVTGRLPFEGRTFGEVVDAILHAAPPPAARFSRDVPGDLEAILRKALEKNPDFRYQTAREIYNDLHALRDALDEAERHGAHPSTIDLRRSSGLGLAGVPVPQNSVAVMTFANITREPSDEWIGSGIAETVGSDLKNLPGLTVVGRERIFDALRNIDSGDAAAQDDRFAIEIGRGLAAKWIVAGGYQRFGEAIRITARLVEVATGAVLRNVKIDGKLADIFALQDRIVFDLTQGLNLQLEQAAVAEIERPETRSVEAYELYSRAVLSLRLASRDAPDRAIALLERAIELDPDYAEAWAAVGGAHYLKGNFLDLPHELQKTLEFERRALELNPKLADAYLWLGAAYLSLGRHDDAIDALEEALGLEPALARAYSFLARAWWIGKGKLAPAIEALEHAVRLNPQFGYAHLQLAFLYTEIGEHEKAEASARRAVELQEQYISGEEGFLVIGARARLGYVFYRQGRYEDALKEYQTELIFLSASDHVLKERTQIELHQKLGAAYHRLGHAAEAERHFKLAIKRYEERVARGADDLATKYYIAAAQALRGKDEKAITLLEDVLERGSSFTVRRAMADPDLESVRGAIRERVGVV